MVIPCSKVLLTHSLSDLIGMRVVVDMQQNKIYRHTIEPEDTDIIIESKPSELKAITAGYQEIEHE